MGRLTASQTVAVREDVAAVLTEVIFQVMTSVIKLPEAHLACRGQLLGYCHPSVAHKRFPFSRSRINRIRGFVLKACLWLLVKQVVCFIAAFDWLPALCHGISHLNNIPPACWLGQGF